MQRFPTWLFVVVLSVWAIPSKADEVALPQRVDSGQLTISFELKPKATPGGAHGGWDFFDGNDKQFWIGSGWGPNAGKWGIWSKPSSKFEFTEPVELGKQVRLVAAVDFGGVASGDESIRLRIGDKEVAALEGVTISGISRATTFVGKGGEFDLGRPSFEVNRAVGQNLSERQDFFRQEIRPIFAEKCDGCHGDSAEKIKGEFDMRTMAGILKGGESGEPGIVLGKPAESPLYISVTREDPDFEMPPKANDRLTEEQIKLVGRWIEMGAPWVKDEPRVAEAKPVVPEGKLGEWSEVDGKGEVRMITSKAQSDTWAERGYDADTLWSYKPREDVSVPDRNKHPIDGFISAALSEAGLAPAPLADPKTLARRLSYTLTGLPPTDEQLGMGLDALLEDLLASPHYGERMAQHWLDVTRYADSNGFSRDEERPDAHKYRTYVIDSFNEDKPFDQFAREQIAGDELGIAGQEALSFLWMGPWEMTNMTSAAVARQMWLDDVVNSVGVTFLGHQMQCAKCHDHKFDPIPTYDYYAMQSVFAGTKHHVRGGQFKIQNSSPQKISILQGGNLESPGEEVGPGMLSAFELTNKYRISDSEQNRRATLANWIADPENPLTARVIVNRVWQWHFGRGLVTTPNAFGVVGSPPTHPELLDFLANWFVEHDWSIKELSKFILTSESWRRSTEHPEGARLNEVDPNGETYAVFRPRRLTAEEIRDSMLAASGELDRRVGGPSIRAQINWEVAFQPRLAMGKLVPPWEPDQKRADRNRRSIYAMRIRNLGHPMMEVLNRPLSELSCEKRDETTVVTQAFSLFHGEFTYARALALADRIIRESPEGFMDQVNALFQAAYGRAPTEGELGKSISHLEKMLVHHRENPPEPSELPSEVTLSNVVEKTGETAYTKFKLNKLGGGYERDLQPWEVNAETRALAELCLVILNSSEFLHVY